MYDAMPEEKKEAFSQQVNNRDLYGVETALGKASLHINKQEFGKALEIIETLLKKLEDENGNFIVFTDDTVSEYRRFINIFEEILYTELVKPTRTLRIMPENFDELYFMYGHLLFELQRYDECEIALIKANRINPISLDIKFEMSEINKKRGNWEKYFQQIKDCLPLAYKSKDIARCYRGFGYYFIEKSDFESASAMYYASMIFDKSTMAQSQLYYISQKTGKATQMPEFSTIQAVFTQNNLEYGANKQVCEIAFGAANHMEQRGNIEGARFFYSILYDLTLNEQIKARMDNLGK